MLSQEVWMDIKLMSHEGRSIREIHRITGLARQTIRKILSEVVPKGYGPRPRRKTKLDDYLPNLLDTVNRRPWLSAVRIYEELKTVGYTGCYEQVKTKVREVRQDAQARSRACVRIETDPGVEAQFDWKGPLRGVVEGQEVYVFRLVLGYSRFRVTRAVRNLKLPAVLSDLQWAFERIGGIPSRIVFDNFKAAVIQPRPNLRLNAGFLAFCAHYGFEPKPHLPFQPQRKGKVERGFRDLEQSDLVHRRYATLAEFQAALDAEDVAHAERIVSTTGARPIDRLERERPFLQSLPATAFDPRPVETRLVLSDCVISFQAAYYSVPFVLVGKRVTVKLDVDGLAFDIFHGADWIARYGVSPKRTRTIRQEHLPPPPRAFQSPVSTLTPIPETPVLVKYPRVDVAIRPLSEYAAALEVTR
jgi:transposase